MIGKSNQKQKINKEGGKTIEDETDLL